MDKRTEQILYNYEDHEPEPKSIEEQITALDQGATKKASMIAIAIGIAGCLVMGIGMSLTMFNEGLPFILGIIIGIVGIALICAAYPIYKKMLAQARYALRSQMRELASKLN